MILWAYELIIWIIKDVLMYTNVPMKIKLPYVTRSGETWYKSTEMLISMNKVKKNLSFCELFSIIFQWSKTFQILFSLLYKSIIREIINMQMRHYIHNGKGYRALPYTKLKLMLCAFQPYIKLNFKFLWHISPFLRAGQHILSKQPLELLWNLERNAKDLA